MTEEIIRVVVAGAAGKMGREVVRTVTHTDDLRLVGAVDLRGIGDDVGTLAGLPPCGVTVGGDLATVLKGNDADVLIDFTNPQAVIRNARLALDSGTAVVIGTTGIDELELDELKKRSRQAGRPVLIAPNFALGAVLMMDFARRAARFFKNVEIIELHHDQKLDAPSGTSLRTAQLIAAERGSHQQGHPDEYEKIPGARGGNWEGIRIHSVRLPGYVAHQEVIFGDLGQTLTIRHDSTSRESFMPGVVLAIHRVGQLTGVVIGLENILD